MADVLRAPTYVVVYRRQTQQPDVVPNAVIRRLPGPFRPIDASNQQFRRREAYRADPPNLILWLPTAAPFRPRLVDNPLGRKSFQPDTTVPNAVIGRIAVSGSPPFSQLDWQNPNAKRRDAYVEIPPNAIRLLMVAPLRPIDWTNPQGRKRDAYSDIPPNTIGRLPVVLPFRALNQESSYRRRGAYSGDVHQNTLLSTLIPPIVIVATAQALVITPRTASVVVSHNIATLPQTLQLTGAAASIHAASNVVTNAASLLVQTFASPSAVSLNVQTVPQALRFYSFYAVKTVGFVPLDYWLVRAGPPNYIVR